MQVTGKVYFNLSNVLTYTTVILKEYTLNQKFMLCFKITIKWNLTKSYAKSTKHNLYAVETKIWNNIFSWGK